MMKNSALYMYVPNVWLSLTLSSHNNRLGRDKIRKLLIGKSITDQYRQHSWPITSHMFIFHNHLFIWFLHGKSSADYTDNHSFNWPDSVIARNTYHNMLELGQYRPDASSIRQILAQFWHIMISLWYNTGPQFIVSPDATHASQSGIKYES